MLPRAWPFLMIFFLIFSVPALFAQEEDDYYEPPPIDIDVDWFDLDITGYSRGDRTFAITLGMIFPTVFWGQGAYAHHDLSMGGTGTLAFSYFLSPHVFIGGELSGMFAGTRANNMLYMVPFGFRFGYQFVHRRFEFPVSLMVGFAPQMYLEYRFFGIIFKPSVSAFWRFNPDWSFGLNTMWWFVPQWPRGGRQYDVFANFLTVTLSARYHF